LADLFFQEWQPLLPIFHRPSFLRIYEQFLADPEATQWQSNKQAIAQLYLIFDISALSSMSRVKQSSTSYEPHWRKALHSTSSNVSISTLQCHVLAELHYLLKADYTRLAKHRAIAVSMCHQLGLHQSQNFLSLPVLDAETRKKVFWCQYVMDK
jgi:Fungal specific transcription factor domain